MSKDRKTPEVYLLYNLYEVKRFDASFYGIDIIEMVSGDTVSQIISDNIEKAQELFNLFWENYVTPCTTCDIIQDLKVGELFFE